MMKTCAKIPTPTLAYAALSLGFGLMSHVVSFYYVKIFMDKYRIPPFWFQIAQGLYLVWNAINDPLFAYIQDKAKLGIVKTRRHAVLYCAPAFALSFLIFWFPWEEPGEGTWITGLQLIIGLCFYDACFTFVGLAACCLFTEMSHNNEYRLQLIRLSTIGSLIGSSSVYICEFTSDSLKNYGNFQITCIALAIISCLLMRYCGNNAHTQYDLKGTADDPRDMSEPNDSIDGDIKTMARYTWQILRNRNFASFVTVNFLQEFHRAFIFNFAAIITDSLLPSSVISSGMRMVYRGFMGTLPSILVFFSTPLIRRFGYYRLIMWNFYIKIFTSLVLFLIGWHHPWFLMLVILIDSGYTSAAFGIFNLPLSDVSEEDATNHNRNRPLTSMIYGTNALVVKPAQSIAPMIVSAILNAYGYQKLQDETLGEDGVLTLNNTMFYLACFIPISVAFVQLFAWSRYTIRSSHVQEVVVDISEL